ncbi:MAG: hypothetical protein IJS44_02785 [Clostridia bacterium]|nr:hypothetical protein [Clostridia bacterium]
MYIIKNGESFMLSDTDKQAIVSISAPVVEENGREFVLQKAEDGSGYAGFGFSATETVESCGDGLFKVTRTVKNEGYTPRIIKVIFETVTAYVPTHYLIPCVSYNGNVFGEGNEPKGLYHKNGQPWIHSFERTSVPSCSLTETKDVAFSLFASAADKDSMVSSVSMRYADEDKRISQRIYWPVTEAPFTYHENDKYNEPLHTYITLACGESFTATVFMLASVPLWENYGICQTLDRALELFPFTHEKNRTTDEIWRLGIAYSRYLQTEFRGKLLFSSGTQFSDKGPYLIPHFEIGWCGQNIMNARMHVIEYLRTGERTLLDNAIKVCDTWLEKQHPSGLVLAHWEWYTDGLNSTVQPRDYSKSWASNVNYKTGWLPETCNTAWAGCEMLKMWDLLRKNGIDRPDYKEFAIKILDFFCAHYSDEFGFGKAWDFDGTCVEKDGTIGAFVTMALTESYRILGDEKYLEFAKKSLAFYMKRDLEKFICTAGAIDCTCEDKETAGPVIIAALDLYEFTKDKQYLEYARKASYYFASWMYVYDGWYGPDKEFTKYGYYTSGSTAVSVQHPALDQWGELMCCEWLRLADYTGDERWKKRALMMWYNATQCIADEKNRVFHGKERPIGAQNEAFYQARWGHRKNCNESGHLNDWCVSWVNVFRLNVLDRLTSINGYADTSSLE